jgi:hypothetical protein
MQRNVRNDRIDTPFIVIIVPVLDRQAVSIQTGKIVSKHNESSEWPIALRNNDVETRQAN